jgi:hypothetical protein
MFHVARASDLLYRPGMRTLGALLLSLGLLACGGSKPAAQEPTEEASTDEIGDSDMPVENEQCCCDYIADPSDDADDMTENHSYDYLSMGACDEAGGVCEADSSVCDE